MPYDLIPPEQGNFANLPNLLYPPPMGLYWSISETLAGTEGRKLPRLVVRTEHNNWRIWAVSYPGNGASRERAIYVLPTSGSEFLGVQHQLRAEGEIAFTTTVEGRLAFSNYFQTCEYLPSGTQKTLQESIRRGSASAWPSSYPQVQGYSLWGEDLTIAYLPLQWPSDQIYVRFRYYPSSTETYGGMVHFDPQPASHHLEPGWQSSYDFLLYFYADTSAQPAGALLESPQFPELKQQIASALDAGEQALNELEQRYLAEAEGINLYRDAADLRVSLVALQCAKEQLYSAMEEYEIARDLGKQIDLPPRAASDRYREANAYIGGL